MRVFLMACLAAIVLALGASGVVNLGQKPADEAFRSTGVRLPPAGH